MQHSNLKQSASSHSHVHKTILWIFQENLVNSSHDKALLVEQSSDDVTPLATVWRRRRRDGDEVFTIHIIKLLWASNVNVRRWLPIMKRVTKVHGRWMNVKVPPSSWLSLSDASWFNENFVKWIWINKIFETQTTFEAYLWVKHCDQPKVWWSQTFTPKFSICTINQLPLDDWAILNVWKLCLPPQLPRQFSF